MHHEVYTGMTGDGGFAGKPHEVFVGGVPDAEDAPPFELKAVEEDTLVKIQQRYDSVVPRLKALFPDGKALRHQPLPDSRSEVNLFRFFCKGVGGDSVDTCCVSVVYSREIGRTQFDISCGKGSYQRCLSLSLVLCPSRWSHVKAHTNLTL